MIATRNHRMILVTAPNRRVARKIVRAALEARVAACGNLVPGLESHYWWQGRRETSAEVLVIFKTTRSKVEDLEQVVRAHHPYDTPEFVVLSLDAGSERYLAWIDASVQASSSSGRRGDAPRSAGR